MAYSRLALAHLQARRFFWGSGFWMVGLLGAGQVVKREHINDTSGESEYLRNLGAKQKTKVCCVDWKLVGIADLLGGSGKKI